MRRSVKARGPPRALRVAIEAGVSDFWRKHVGLGGAVVGLDRFGASAPAKELFQGAGFHPEGVARAVRELTCA